jgi:hypothetical protein
MGNGIYFKNILEIEGKFELQKCSACQDLQKKFAVENVRQLCEELFLLKCIFLLTRCFWLLITTKWVMGFTSKLHGM